MGFCAGTWKQARPTNIFSIIPALRAFDGTRASGSQTIPSHSMRAAAVGVQARCRLTVRFAVLSSTLHCPKRHHLPTNDLHAKLPSSMLNLGKVGAYVIDEFAS